ncbi:ABC transporter substrate-binding protein [Sphingomonas panacis]|uniref:ABC transporter substrate-binding protein n=1 Tax=Sphingomonas panacis TaxID=1560345 RepID=UPI0009F6E66B|nr:ABC transporter substrate-binding protein [Sphingomonas panacis]
MIANAILYPHRLPSVRVERSRDTGRSACPSTSLGANGRWGWRASAAALFSLLLAVLSACGQGSDTHVLRVANQKGSTRAMMEAAGVLKGAPYRIEWSEFPAAQPLMEAVGGGAADLGLAGDAPFIFAYQSGAAVKAVGALATAGNPSDALGVIVRNSSPIHSVGDLVGKTVTTTRGSIGHHILLQALERAKIPADRVTVTFLSPADAKAAFDNGTVDAWAIWPPYISVAIKEGARTVVDARDYELPVSFEVAHTAAIAPKAALMRDFLQREAKALNRARAHPEAFAKVLAKETGLPLDIARASFDRNNRVSVPIDAGIVEHERVVAKRFETAGLIDAKRPVTEAFDTDVGKGLFRPLAAN